IASELGEVVEPTTTSTLSSAISFFAFWTALVVSDASSSTIQLTFSPAIVVGSSVKVFFSGMPSDAAGPVAERVTPTLMSASAAGTTAIEQAVASAVASLRGTMVLLQAIVGNRPVRQLRSGPA